MGGCNLQAMITVNQETSGFNQQTMFRFVHIDYLNIDYLNTHVDHHFI